MTEATNTTCSGSIEMTMHGMIIIVEENYSETTCRFLPHTETVIHCDDYLLASSPG